MIKKSRNTLFIVAWILLVLGVIIPLAIFTYDLGGCLINFEGMCHTFAFLHFFYLGLPLVGVSFLFAMISFYKNGKKGIESGKSEKIYVFSLIAVILLIKSI